MSTRCVKDALCRWSLIPAFLVIFISTAVPGAEVSAGVALVQEGASRAVIVLPATPEEKERLAADELVEHLALMTGAELKVVSEGEEPGNLLPIYLGGAADARLDELTLEKGSNLSSFTLRVAEDRIDVRGIDYRHATIVPDPQDRGEGTLFGVYELLEQLGFRWYIPGELGRVVPGGASAVLALQVETQVPSMDLRLLQPWVRYRHGWIARQRLGGERRSTGGHHIPGVHARRERGKVEEWKAKTEATGWERSGIQVCLSQPVTLERAIAGYRERARQMIEEGHKVQYIPGASHDGGGYCECEGCRELDRGVYDPLGDRISMTDRYVWFFNQVLNELEDEFPNLHIVHYTYGAHMMPPEVAHHERIVPVFAPITLDRIRSMNNPMSPERCTLRWLIDEFDERGVNEMYYRGYYNNLACIMLPKTQIDRVRNDIPAFHERGINVMRVECISGVSIWDTDPVTLYLAARLMWDVNADVDALLEEFYRKFYGPAREPMRRYHERLEAAFRDTPYFTGSSYLYFPIFKDHPRRDELRGILDEAVGIVAGDNTPYSERVHLIRQGYERMDLFLDMIRARNRHDFAQAHQKLEAYESLSRSLRDVEVEYEGTRRSMRMGGGAPSYLNRFFRIPVESGYERAVEKGEMVAAFPDEWDFLLDTAGIGEIAGYYRPGGLGGNWLPLKTSSRSWSDQGLHYYQGWSWYRSSVEIPEEYEGRPVYLWVGAVNTWASVWINGVYVGTSREPKHGLPGVPGTFRPFDMPTLDADGESVLNFGGENWVVIKVVRDRIAELGTGGIMGPVMFWSPEDPAWMPGE